jgi:hypothetical protein
MMSTSFPFVTPFSAPLLSLFELGLDLLQQLVVLGAHGSGAVDVVDEEDAEFTAETVVLDLFGHGGLE